MNKPLVILTNDFEIKPTGVREICCPAPYLRAVGEAGGVPVLTGEQCPLELAERADGLVLTGGGDLEPSYYGEERRFESVVCDETRDAFELALTRAFLKRGRPILAICRGFPLAY